MQRNNVSGNIKQGLECMSRFYTIFFSLLHFQTELHRVLIVQDKLLYWLASNWHHHGLSLWQSEWDFREKNGSSVQRHKKKKKFWGNEEVMEDSERSSTKSWQCK